MSVSILEYNTVLIIFLTLLQHSTELLNCRLITPLTDFRLHAGIIGIYYLSKTLENFHHSSIIKKPWSISTNISSPSVRCLSNLKNTFFFQFFFFLHASILFIKTCSRTHVEKKETKTKRSNWKKKKNWTIRKVNSFLDATHNKSCSATRRSGKIRFRSDTWREWAKSILHVYIYGQRESCVYNFLRVLSMLKCKQRIHVYVPFAKFN